MVKRLVDPAIDGLVKDGVDFPSLYGGEALRGLRNRGVVADLTTPGFNIVQRKARGVQDVLDIEVCGMARLFSQRHAQRDSPLADFFERRDTRALGDGEGHLILRGDHRDDTEG